jgi:hypothetical protein
MTNVWLRPHRFLELQNAASRSESCRKPSQMKEIMS